MRSTTKIRVFILLQEVRLRCPSSQIRNRLIALASVIALATASACRQSYPLGKLSVRISDASDAPVAGVAADLVKITPSKRIYWRAARTNASGIAVFGERNGGVIEGDYMVHITLTPWQKFAPGETNDRPVTLKKGDDTVIRFRVIPKKPLLQLPRLSH